MEEFKSAMFDFPNFQHEQQKRHGSETTWAAKKNGSTPDGFTKRTALNSKTNRNLTTKTRRNSTSNST